ncbi:hypothetical protein, partial [Aliivibrio fischeri]|uniref:hypothetical protein n=1 Tax=Aliivibrio fischeri TaxID=668 RepID=UPI001BDD6F7A
PGIFSSSKFEILMSLDELFITNTMKNEQRVGMSSVTLLVYLLIYQYKLEMKLFANTLIWLTFR